MIENSISDNRNNMRVPLQFTLGHVTSNVAIQMIINSKVRIISLDYLPEIKPAIAAIITRAPWSAPCVNAVGIESALFILFAKVASFDWRLNRPVGNVLTE